MPKRNAVNPHRIHEARRPEHITDEHADKTIAALSDIAHGEKLGHRSRSRESSDPAGKRIDKLIANLHGARLGVVVNTDHEASLASAPRGQAPSPVRHPGDPTRRTGESSGPPRSGASLSRGKRTPVELAPEPPAEVIHARLRRTALVPSTLTVPCPAGHADAGEHCFAGVAYGGVCWRRVQARAALR